VQTRTGVLRARRQEVNAKRNKHENPYPVAQFCLSLVLVWCSRTLVFHSGYSQMWMFTWKLMTKSFKFVFYKNNILCNLRLAISCVGMSSTSTRPRRPALLEPLWPMPLMECWFQPAGLRRQGLGLLQCSFASVDSALRPMYVCMFALAFFILVDREIYVGCRLLCPFATKSM
jgi:hypothetical protein